MTWFRVDDKFPTSPKVMRIPRRHRLAAIGLWATAGAWAAGQLQDGVVPAYMVEEWTDDLELAEALVKAGLWDETDDGFVFHDWADWQPTRAQVHARRESERRRKENWRAQKAGNTGQSPAGTSAGHAPDGTRDERGADEIVPLIPTRPDPTRPEEGSNDPSSPQTPRKRGAAGRAKPALPLPSDWEPSDAHHEFAAKHGIDLDFEVMQFRAHAEANDRRQASWNGAFTTWLGKASQRPRPATGSWTLPPQAPRPGHDAARQVAWLAKHGITQTEFLMLCSEHGEREARRIVEGRARA